MNGDTSNQNTEGKPAAMTPKKDTGEMSNVNKMSNMNQNTNQNMSLNQEKEKDSSAGPIVGSIIVIVIIVLGGLYLLSQRGFGDGVAGDEIRLQEDSAVVDLQTQSNSDVVADIERDLNDTNLDNLDEEFGDIDSELGF